MQVTGQVQGVTGEKGKASVRLLGNLDRPVSQLGFADFVSCEIEQAASLAKSSQHFKNSERDGPRNLRQGPR